MKLTETIDIMMSRPMDAPLLMVKQGDTGRSVSARLFQEYRGNKIQVVVPNDETVTLYVRKPDDAVASSVCTVNDGLVNFDIPSTDLAIKGVIYCELELSDTDGVITSPIFKFIVAHSNIERS